MVKYKNVPVTDERGIETRVHIKLLKEIGKCLRKSGQVTYRERYLPNPRNPYGRGVILCNVTMKLKRK